MTQSKRRNPENDADPDEHEGSDDQAAQESDDSNDAEELELSLDSNGRPEGVDDAQIEYGFTVCEDALLEPASSVSADTLDSLRHDAEALADPSGEETYFVHANTRTESCTCTLERLALQIFHLHAQHAVGFDAARSGAEFWTQVIHPNDEIGFHHDSDGLLEEDSGVCVHPHIATVTALSESGNHPTVVVEGAPSVFADENSVITVPRAHVAYPSTGKHISFDGRWAHGAPALRNVQSDQDYAEAYKRITLLCNVWLNHVPVGATQLSTEQTANLKSAPSVHMPSPSNTLCGTVFTVRNVSAMSNSTSISKQFYVRHNKRQLNLTLPSSVLEHDTSSVTFKPTDCPKIT